MRCAHYIATPDDGLQLRVDGVPQLGELDVAKARIANSDGTFGYDDDVVGAVFDVAPGRHRFEIITRDCAPIERDVLVSPGGTTAITGRLAITNAHLLGTVGAPDHLGVIAGVAYGAAPATSGTNVASESSWTASASRPKGAWLALTFERRYLAAAFDWDIGATNVSGTTTNIDPQRAPASSEYEQRGWYMRWAGRIGARLPLEVVSLAAGTGMGLELGMPETPSLEMPTTEDLGARESWRGLFVPVWASVTYKPTCDWGVVALASYDVHPFTTSTDVISLALGLTYQPSAACSAPAEIHIDQH
ncbi:MAG TPA: hypothetical protein VH143_26085 [Kofleriaceae bacterium]|nr:hypothetical protein [Kofleriaceae bacterium]